MTSARILIVEDSRVVARDIRQQLTRLGHKVVGMTARGEEVLQLVGTTGPELILMDIRLEDQVDGIEAAHLVRQRHHIPVIFLSAYSDEETLHRARFAEPFGYVLKPVQEAQLRTVIEMTLYKHSVDQKLRQSERRYVATLSSIGDAVIATDNQVRITFMNPVAESLTGWTQPEALDQDLTSVFSIINEETRRDVENPAGAALRLGAPVGLADHTVLISRNGQEIPIDDSGAPIIDDRGNVTGAVLVFRDIAKRKKAEDALRASQEALTRATRLTTMGELAASIAHEVNQPLLAIVTNAATCLRWLSDHNFNVVEARQAAERIISDGHRAGDVIRSVRELATKSSHKVAPLDFGQLIGESLGHMAGELRQHEITLELDLPLNFPLVQGDRVQLQQVILNLVKNGIEAMSATFGQPRVLRIGLESRGTTTVLITVADTGIGLDPMRMRQMFDGFFTTKLDGIGLGLSICRSIVERHGGRLWASANHPYGSLLIFTLPVEATSCGHGDEVSTTG